MKTALTARIMIVIVLVISGYWVKDHLASGTSSQADVQATITITQPDGVADVVGEGDDYASNVLGDPWDMNEHTDILALHIANEGTISNGQLHYRVPSTASDTFVHVLYPGIDGAMDLGKLGVNFPIDTNRYRWLSFRMNQPEGKYQIRWHYAKHFRKWAGTRLLDVVPGWHTYVIDLETVPIGLTIGGATGWDGQVIGLDLASIAQGGTQIDVDWIRLTPNNPTGNSLPIAWSDLSPSGSDVAFWLDTDQSGCDGAPIHNEEDASTSGAFTWGQASGDVAAPANILPGDYYVCARVNGGVAGYSAGKLTVNAAPIVHFTQPSYTSGDDYATDAGNPWDFDSTADLAGLDNGTASIQNGILGVTVPASATDVRVWLNVPTSIERNKYYYLTYRLWFDFPYTLDDVGQITRVFWGRKPNTETTSGLIYDYPGWQTYSVDLRTLELHHGLEWSVADWTLFRIDPISNLTGQTVTFYLDFLKLTADEKADAFADITWELMDPDSSSTTMDLYYDVDDSGLNGTHVATLALTDGERTALALSADADARFALGVTDTTSPTVYLPATFANWYPPCKGPCYSWDTSSITPGAYYLYACLNDGYNELCRYSERPLFISHP